MARALAAECRLPFVERVDADAVTTDVATRLPITYAKSHGLLVTAERDDAVEVIVLESARHGRPRRRARDVPQAGRR